MIFSKIEHESFEQIVYCNDPKVGLKAIISIHSTKLGPATGGCRQWAYTSEDAALTDVLRLSKGMTYKSAIAGLKWGGGKAVILADPARPATRETFERFGEFVDRLGGHYITAKDVGVGSQELKWAKTKTSHVLGIDGEPGSSGDPSPATAWGVYHGLRAAVKHATGANSMKGITVAVQGLGSVAYNLMEHLSAEGAKLVGCDVNPAAIERAKKKFNIEIVNPEAIYDVSCDVFSPNALGATINPQTLPRIRAKVIAGGANNQLATPEVGFELLKRDMVYAPDYALNGGGVIDIYHEYTGKGVYDRKASFDYVARIGDTIAKILDRSKSENEPTHRIADRIVEERLARGE